MDKDCAIQPDEVRSALARILASNAIGSGSRLGAILSFLVEEELAGRGHRIKAYAVATGPLGRDSDFDPSHDNIVRVEANRLRQALAAYDRVEGLQDPIRIEIPKGGYRPTFLRKSSVLEPKSRKTRWPVWAGLAFLLIACVGALFWQFGETTVRHKAGFTGPRILIDRFRPVGQDPQNERLAVGLVSELVTDLSQYHWLSIAQWIGDQPAITSLVDTGISAPDYLLSGETSLDGEAWQITARLQRLSDLSVVWNESGSVPLKAGEIERTRTAIAHHIANRIGSVQGIVPVILRSDSSPLDDIEFQAFDCVLGMQIYWQDPAQQRHRELRQCLEETTAAFPQYAEAWAALVYIYIDEQRHGRNPRAGADSWRDAENASIKALAAAPLSSMVLNAAMTFAVERPDRDLDSFRQYGKRELELRPNNSFTLANYGMKLAIYAGDFTEGLAMVERALELNPEAPEWYYLAPAYAAVLGNDDDALFEATRQLDGTNSFSSLILRTIASARTGEIDDLYSELERLDALSINNAEAAKHYVVNRRFTPELEAAMLQQLAEAYIAGKR